jgi:hypothetical protein
MNRRLYKKYIKEHRTNVKLAWNELINWIDFINYEDWKAVNDLIRAHDKSKYSKEEFEAYRNFFFFEDGDKKAFTYAWNHHQKTNPHHWQYWLMYKDGKTIALEMPFKYVIEMFCDWLAMSIKFDNLPSKWYNENKDNMLLHEKTLEVVEAYIEILDKAYKNMKGDRL